MVQKSSLRNKMPLFQNSVISYLLTHIYRPQRSWGKVIFSVACVKNSVHRGGSAPLHAGIPPWDQAPPEPDTTQPLAPDTQPWDQTPPGTKHPPGPDTSPLGPGTPPPQQCMHAGRYGQQAGGTHPTGMQFCLLERWGCLLIFLHKCSMLHLLKNWNIINQHMSHNH